MVMKNLKKRNKGKSLELYKCFKQTHYIKPNGIKEKLLIQN